MAGSHERFVISEVFVAINVNKFCLQKKMGFQMRHPQRLYSTNRKTTTPIFEWFLQKKKIPTKTDGLLFHHFIL